MKLRKLMAGIVAVTTAMMLLAGCSGGKDADSKDSGDKAAATEGYHTAKDPYDGDKVKIAYVPNIGSAANAQAWEKGIRQVLEPLNEIYGTIEFNVFDPNGNNEQQISILTDLCA